MSELSSTPNAVRAGTTLYALLWPHKEHITKRWIDIVHGSYPFETVGFLRTRKDQFANPVGYRTEQAAAALLDVLFTEAPDQFLLKAYSVPTATTGRTPVSKRL